MESMHNSSTQCNWSWMVPKAGLEPPLGRQASDLVEGPHTILVPGAGLEPAQPLRTKGF